MNPAELVTRKLGIRPLARKLGLSPSAITQWKKRGRIPTKYFSQLQKLENFTLEELVHGK